MTLMTAKKSWGYEVRIVKNRGRTGVLDRTSDFCSSDQISEARLPHTLPWLSQFEGEGPSCVMPSRAIATRLRQTLTSPSISAQISGQSDFAELSPEARIWYVSWSSQPCLHRRSKKLWYCRLVERSRLDAKVPCIASVHWFQ